MSEKERSMTFYENWVSERSQKSLIPFLESLKGTRLRFRNDADRNKTYQFHSPAKIIADKMTLYIHSLFAENGFATGVAIKIGCSLLNDNNEKKKYDRFLTVKVFTGGGEDWHRECAYITLKIAPCEVEPLKKGGITEGSEIVGYEIAYQNGCEDASLHSLMQADPELYAEWLEKEIKKEYMSRVKAVLESKEQSEPFAIIRYLTDETEEEIRRAKKLTNQLL